MKKLTLFFMTLIVFNLSFAAETTTFTFDEEIVAVTTVKSTQRIKALGNSRISYPMFINNKNPNVIKNMNKNMEKFISGYKSTKSKSYIVSSEIKANNNLYVSVLFTIEEKNAKTGEKTKLYDGITFNVKDGKALKLKDLFISDYSDSLSLSIENRFKQFGLFQSDEFNPISKNQSFYMENDAVVLIYNKGEATDFADGEAFIPLMLNDLTDILR